MSRTPPAAKYSASRSVETMAGPAGEVIAMRATSSAFAVFRCGRNVTPRRARCDFIRATLARTLASSSIKQGVGRASWVWMSFGIGVHRSARNPEMRGDDLGGPPDLHAAAFLQFAHQPPAIFRVQGPWRGRASRRELVDARADGVGAGGIERLARSVLRADADELSDGALQALE